jgi:transaldolase
MATTSYLQWLGTTPTAWWNDSALPYHLRRALEHGATGVTTNPVLAQQALYQTPEYQSGVQDAMSNDLSPAERAEVHLRQIVQAAAGVFLPVYERTKRRQGQVCAQVNPRLATDAAAMLDMAKRWHAWAPNISIKLPVTASGLAVLEECTALGISTTATVSFTVPQVIAVAERHRKGRVRAQRAGIVPGSCYAVIMIGRLDDYLRDIAHDQQAPIEESDICTAGLAVTKRAYTIFQERKYEATLIVAALRGIHHMLPLAGGALVMSLHPTIQELLLQPTVPREVRIDQPVDPSIIRRLFLLPEFIRAYEPTGMQSDEFITYGATQRTLSQFIDAGWGLLETFQPTAHV